MQEPATEVFTPFLTKGLTTYKHCWQYAGPKMFCQLGHCAGLYCSVPSLNVPKGPSCYPQKYHVSVSNMLSYPLKCFMENENKHKFQGPNLSQTPCKVLVQGLYFTPRISCPKFLPKILTYFSFLKIQKITMISPAII